LASQGLTLIVELSQRPLFEFGSEFRFGNQAIGATIMAIDCILNLADVFEKVWVVST
jgi:hypothetical protein